MRNASYEQALKKQGVDFTYLERLELAAIDTAKGLRNQARLLNPLDEDLVKQYEEMYRDGSDGPPLVVYKQKNKSVWVPMDGNQRLHAAKAAGKKTLDAYVVQSDDPMVLDRITWSFNNWVNGKRLAPDEALEHAKTMVLKYGMDCTAAAKEWGLNQWLVKKAVTASKLRDKLRANNVAAPCELTDDKLEELAPFTKLGDDVFTAAASIAHRCGLAALDIKEMKKEVDRAKTSEEKAKVVRTFGESDLAKQRQAETKNGRVKPAKYHLPSERLHTLLSSLADLLNQYEGDSVALRRGSRSKESRKLAGDVCDNLILIFGLGARPKAEVG